ncbi:MAG: hybrid sensor histidine kinase/response regulator [Bacteroidetes bacterium]|nr:hybrid sensor histidine kinase/response regulator [Bacteroidota bacterium]
MKTKDLILVIDDQPNNLKVIAGLLANEYEISIASNGETALSMLEKAQPDLILLDIMMPGMDGFETCKQLKSNPNTASIPVIFLTAKTDIDDITKGFKCGAVDYVTKPFNPAEVKARVKNHLGLYKSQNLLSLKNLELLEAELELTNMLDISRNQNERLKSFAHIVSHNLRSHARNISSLLEYLKEENQALEESEIYRLLKNASSNLLDTITNLSEVAILAAGDKKDFKVVNLGMVIEKALENVSALAKSQGVNLINQVPENIQVLGIPAYTDSIILNLLTNAIKYSDPAKESFVRLSYSNESGLICIHVEDNGLGIDLVKFGKQLFGMYKTFHDHHDSKGFGLFITKNQIEAIGGKIEVESSPGIGTRFKVYFQPEKRLKNLSETLPGSATLD